MSEHGYRRVKTIIYDKFGKESWYGNVSSYLLQRYRPIEDRMINSFRYVSCHPNNRNTFSYEYASILRDAGSVFGSVMDRLVRESVSVSRQLDIRDYRKWLIREVENVHMIATEISFSLRPRAVEGLLLPFLPLRDEDSRLDWWDAYNDVKHSDIDRFKVGNFENALNSMAALAILLTLIAKIGTKLFVNIGFFYPEEYLQSLLFFKTF